MWPAYAADGKGHHDGDGQYVVKIPAEDFGDHLYLNGDARMDINGGEPTVFRLPSQPPSPGTVLVFRLQVNPLASLGLLAMVNGLEVRARV